MGDISEYHVIDEAGKYEAIWDLYDSRKLKWNTKSGDSIIIQEMSTSHLENTIKMLKRNKCFDVMLEIMEYENSTRNVDGMKVCDVCGKVDVSQKHIEKCSDINRWSREENIWK